MESDYNDHALTIYYEVVLSLLQKKREKRSSIEKPEPQNSVSWLFHQLSHKRVDHSCLLEGTSRAKEDFDGVIKGVTTWKVDMVGANYKERYVGPYILFPLRLLGESFEASWWSPSFWMAWFCYVQCTVPVSSLPMLALLRCLFCWPMYI